MDTRVHFLQSVRLQVTWMMEKYFICPIDLDIMKCLVSKDHYCSLSGGLYAIQNNKDCALALYFKNDDKMRSFCPILVQDISRNFVLQLNPNQYLFAIVEQSPIKHRCSNLFHNSCKSPPISADLTEMY